MVKWDRLISKSAATVQLFAVGNLSGDDFVSRFKGNPNEARRLVRANGTTYSRRLARKALRRRGLLT